MGEGGVQSNGRACRLRAPFKAHPAYGDSHAILSMRPTADPFSDGDTPSLPFNPHGRARMLRAPFKSRPSRGDSDAIPSTRPTPDLISDGDRWGNGVRSILLTIVSAAIVGRRPSSNRAEAVSRSDGFPARQPRSSNPEPP